MKPQSRKVQKLGLSSLGISLPKGWIQALGLEAGTSVLVHQEDDGSLRITTEGIQVRSTPAECVVDADNCQERGFLERLILASYMVGCNTLRVKARSELDGGQVEEIQRALAKLTGVTPVDQGNRYLTLENFAEPSKFPVEGLLRRLQFLISRIQNLTFQMAVKGGDLRDQIRSSREEVEKLYYFSVRQLLLAARDSTVAKLIGLGDPRNVVGARAFAILMQDVADSYLEIADSWIVLGQDPIARRGRVVEELNGLWGRFNDLTEATMGAFFGRDLRRANAALDQVTGIMGTLQEAALKASLPREDQGETYCATCLSLQSVLRPLKTVARLYGSIAEVSLNRSLEEAMHHAAARAGEPTGTVAAALP